MTRSPGPSTRIQAARWVGLAVVAVLLLGQAKLFSHAIGVGIDDAYIAFIYSRNLAEHGRPDWTLGGEHVEGYTNFLWMAMMGAVHRVGLPLAPSFKLLGGLAALGVLTVVARFEANPDVAGQTVPLPLRAAVLGAACSNLALYAMSGIETTWFALLVSLGAWAHVAGRGGAAAAAFGLASLTRPEGAMFFGLAALHRLLEPRPWSDLLRRGAVFLAIVGPHVLFRKLYYGLWLPHSFYVKAGGYDRLDQWRHGWTSLRGFYQHEGAFLLAALVAAVVLHRPWTRAKKYFFLNVAVHGVYVCSIGFDFMPQHRHQVMIYPFLLPLAAMGLLGLERRLGRLAPAVMVVALALGAARSLDLDTGELDFHRSGGLGRPDIRLEIGRHLGSILPPGAVIATGECGKIPYFARRDAIDLSGINDREIGRQRPYVQKKPAPLPLSTLLARRPEVVLIPSFQLGLTPKAVSDVSELAPVPTFSDPAFLQAWELREDSLLGMRFYYYRLRDRLK